MAEQTATEKILEIRVKYTDAITAIAKYQTEIDKLKQHEKELRDELKKAQKDETLNAQQRQEAQEKYNLEMAKSTAERKQYSEAIRVVSKQIQNERKQQTELEGSLKSLRAELSNLTAEYDGLSRTERNAARGKELEEKINAITDELKGAEEETQRFYRNVGNYEDSIKNAIGLNNDFANSIMEIAQNSKGNFFQGLTTQVKAFGQTLLGLLSNPVFLALAGIAGAGMAFKWFYDYNKGLVEATRLTKQFTGLGGDELKAYRNEVQVLADTYGKDFTEVLRSANALSKQFGIDQQEALSLVKDGFIAGADASGEFMDILREYPAYFNEAGISAEEFVAITANATQQGIFSDKGIDAIKEANTRLREMTTSTAEALDGIGISSAKVQADLQSGATTTWEVMQQVADKLNELPESSAQVGTAIANIFGSPGEDAGLAYLKTLGDIDLSLDNLKAKTGELGEAQEELMESQLNLQNALSGLADMTGGDFEKMEAAAKSFLNNGLATLISGVRDVVNWFKELYNESMALRAMFQGIAVPLEVAYTAISFFVKNCIEQFRLLGSIIKAAFTLDWDAVEEGWERYRKSVVENSKKLVNGIKDTYKSAAIEIFVNPDDNKTPATTSKSVTRTPTTTTSTNDKKTLPELQATVDAKKKELEEIRKAEDEMLALVKDSREKQRKETELAYDREIEDLQNRLTTEKDLTAKAREAINTQITALEQQKQNALDKLSEEELKKEIENRQKIIELQLEVVKKGSEEEFKLQKEQLEAERDAELADAELTEEMKLAITKKYQKMESDLTDQHEKDVREKQMKAIQMRYENEIMQMQQAGASELDILNRKAEQMKEAYENINRADYDSEVEYNNAKLQARQDYLDAKQRMTDKEVEIEQSKYQAIASLSGNLSDLLQQAAGDNKAMAQLAKVLAIAEVAIAQGVAIANAVKTAASSSATWIDMLAAIGTVVASITAVMGTAMKSVRSAKFARGGLVTGPGSETSDSIPARLSNGESVMTAAATSMFGPILSSFNQMGGGVPINVANAGSQAVGEEMLAKAVAKGMMMAPPPVVSVEEFTSVANRVKYVENLGSV